MDIIITQWALDAYLDTKHKNVFSNGYYTSVLRPNVEKLKNYPHDSEFGNPKFWSVATLSTTVIQNGYKMKWHQVGNGKVQLRLPVYLMKNAFLCNGYIKRDEKFEKRMLAKFKVYRQLIINNHHIERGKLL